MASERETFGLSGPLHLTVIDWNNAHHRRSIAASLVKGEFFNFQLIHVLVDPDDLSFFGCVYERKIPYPYFNHASHQSPPKYVITFRGTVTKPDARSLDLKLNLQCIKNTLHRSSRFQLGLRAVQDFCARAGAGNIWLAGHSLGSAIALLIGRNMVKMERCHIKTYLFNPPFPSLPLEKIFKNGTLRKILRFGHSIIKADLAADVNPDQDDHFAVLSGWIPYLFVNPSDPICSGYTDYFEHWEKMIAIGCGELGRLAARNSILSIISAARGNDSEAFHLLPSADLTTNLSPSEDFMQAHGIHQWWRSDVLLGYKLYKFR